MNSPPQKTRFAAVAVLVAAGMIAAAHMFKLAPALPVLRHDLALGIVAAGWLVAIVNLMAALTGVAAGALADRFGAARLLLAGLLLAAFASAATALFPGTVVVFIYRLLEGVGFLAVTVSAPSLMMRVTALRDRPLVLSIWSTYSPAGGALALLLAAPAMTVVGWHGVWLGLAALSVVAAVAVKMAGIKGSSPGAGPQRFTSNLMSVIHRPGPWCAAGSFALYTIQYSALMAWLPTFLVEQRHLPIVTAGALTAFVMAVNISGNLLAGALLRRGVRHGTLIAAASIVMALCAGIIFSSLPDGLRYAACALLSAAGGLLPAAVLAAAPHTAPSPGHIGTMNGMIVQGSNIGLLMGPPLLASLVAISGRWEAGMGLFLTTALAAAALGLTLNRVSPPADH